MTTAAVRLRQWRLERRETQEQFAALIGKHVGMVRKWEGGTAVPGGDALIDIAGTGVNLHWLLTGQGPMRALQAGQPAPPPPAGTSTAPNQAANSPTALPAALQPLERRIGAVLGMLGNLPELEAAALLDEFAARASTQQQLSELRQAVQQLSFANGKRA